MLIKVSLTSNMKISAARFHVGLPAASKDELLDMIQHGAEKIVNSNDGCVIKAKGR